MCSSGCGVCGGGGGQGPRANYSQGPPGCLATERCMKNHEKETTRGTDRKGPKGNCMTVEGPFRDVFSDVEGGEGVSERGGGGGGV